MEILCSDNCVLNFAATIAAGTIQLKREVWHGPKWFETYSKHNSFNQQSNNKFWIPLCPSDDPACFLTACVSQVHPGACGRGQQQQWLKSRRHAAGSARAQAHTVAIWTFTFHKVSDFARVILKINVKQLCRPKVSIFWPEMSNIFTHCTSIFCQSCQFQCFLHSVDAIPKSWNTRIAIWRKNVTQRIQPFWNSNHQQCPNALDLTTQ